MPDILHNNGTASIAQRKQKLIALFTVAARHFDLDQFMMIQRQIQLSHDGIGQSVLAESDDGL